MKSIKKHLFLLLSFLPEAHSLNELCLIGNFRVRICGNTNTSLNNEWMNVLTVVVVSDTVSRQIDCLCELCNVCIPVCWSVGISSTMRPWERAFASCSFNFLTSACSCLTLPWVSSFTIAYRDTNTQISLHIPSRIRRRSGMFGWIILLFNLIFDEFGSLSELQSGQRLQSTWNPDER